MPRVPTVTGPQVAEQSLQTAPQRSAASPGLLDNPQMAQMGRAMAEVGAQIQERTDADLLMRAETEIKNRYAQWEAQAKQRRGVQAWDVTKDAAKFWDDESGKVGEMLTNPRQQALFGQTVTKLRTQSLGVFASHEADQRRVSLIGSARSSIDGSIDLAAASPTPEVIGSAKTDILSRTQMLAKLEGWSPERVQVEASDHLTKLHTQVLQTLVDKDPARAADYFSVNKGEIAGSKHAELERLVNTGTTLRKAQTFADDAIARGLDEASALKEARERLDGEDERIAVVELKTRFAERTVARERMQRDAADEAFAIYARTGRVSAVPPSLLEKMDGRTVLALRQQAQADADRMSNREVRLPPTNWERYYQLRQQAINDPQAFARRDLRADFPDLGKSERESLIDLQAKANNPAELKDAATLSAQLSNTHDLMKWTGAGSAELRGRFDLAATDAINTEERRLGKKLGYEERQKIIDRMLVQGDINGRWPGGSRQWFQVVGTPDAANFVAQVPDSERKKIEDALRRNKQPVTDDAVRALYQQKLGL